MSIHFDLYIQRVFKQVNPNGKLKKAAREFINEIIDKFLKEMIPMIITLTEHKRTITISARDVQSVIRILFTRQLSKHAISEGVKAVTRYVSFINKDKKKTSYATKAGLIFPPTRVRKIMEDMAPNYRTDIRIGETAPIYLTAVLEYLIAEILAVGGNNVTVDDIKKGIEKDDELRLSLCKFNVSLA